MRITLNLATRPFTDIGPALKRLRMLMGALALLSLVFTGGFYLLHNKAEQARARDHSLDGKIAAINQERQGYRNMMQEPQNVQLLAESTTLNQLFDEKTFSWTLAMEDLETVLPGGVQVSTLEPLREKDGRITLRLRVAGPRDRAVQLVANLEHSRRFTLPRIVGENAEATGGANQHLEPVSASNRVNFDIQAQYNPITLAEFKKADKAGQSKDSGEADGKAPARRKAAVKPRTAKPNPQHRSGQAAEFRKRPVPAAAGSGALRKPHAGTAQPPAAHHEPAQGGSR